jgi:POT family proton-dependent oligopeptide transporter
MTWAAVKQPGTGQVSALWLLGCFFMLTLGELLLYPVGMALITSLIPKRAAAGAIGLWFVAVALGQWLAGESGALWETWPHARFFAMLAGVSLAALGFLALSSSRIAQVLTNKGRAA